MNPTWLQILGALILAAPVVFVLGSTVVEAIREGQVRALIISGLFTLFMFGWLIAGFYLLLDYK